MIEVNYLLSKEKFDKIKTVFEKFGTERLAPIYNYFNEEFSYDEIRLAKVIVKSEKNVVDMN